jgi:hypothetical protein
MSKSELYKKQETAQQTVNEPVAAYSSVSVNSIPEDALVQAAQFAIKEHGEGKCIPHSQIDRVIKERMRWK